MLEIQEHPLLNLSKICYTFISRNALMNIVFDSIISKLNPTMFSMELFALKKWPPAIVIALVATKNSILDLAGQSSWFERFLSSYLLQYY